jgi:SNF2 family DNA or RNA helicase
MLTKAMDKGQPFMAIANYEALQAKPFKAALQKWKPEVIILDESHKIKNPTAARTRCVLQLAEAAKYRYILSGTPIVNSVFDLFPQFLFLDKGRLFGKRLLDFKMRFFKDMNAHMPRHCYFPDWQPKIGALEEINRLLYSSGYVVRKKKSEALDLPPFIRDIRNVELGAEQKRVYRAMEKDAVAWYQQTVISADLAIKRALRLQQIVTGHIVDDEGNIRAFDINPRLQALGEVVDSLPKEAKFIIWAVFKQNYAQIEQVLNERGIIHGRLHGGVSQGEQQQNIKLFNDLKSPMRALVAHPASGGTGANLTAASYSIIYSRNFNWGDDYQAEGRNYRGGSEIHEKITRIDLVTGGTIDALAHQALLDKQASSEIVLKFLKR